MGILKTRVIDLLNWVFTCAIVIHLIVLRLQLPYFGLTLVDSVDSVGVIIAHMIIIHEFHIIIDSVSDFSEKSH